MKRGRKLNPEIAEKKNVLAFDPREYVFCEFCKIVLPPEQLFKVGYFVECMVNGVRKTETTHGIYCVTCRDMVYNAIQNSKIVH